jgi:hypothetical protein
MCGRVVQARGPLQVAVLCGLDVPDTRFANVPPRYNAAPSQELWAIRQNNDTGHRSRDLLKWGLIPYWSKEKPKPPPINAKAETVAFRIMADSGSAPAVYGGSAIRSRPKKKRPGGRWSRRLSSKQLPGRMGA